MYMYKAKQEVGHVVFVAVVKSKRLVFL